jgi:pilus assembly protein CpaB
LRASTFVMVGFAVLFGLVAVFLAQTWLNNQADMRARTTDTQQQVAAAPMRTIVVASQPLRFGTELAAPMLKEMPWANDTLPPGAYSKISDVLKGGRRVVLAPIEISEPVLAVKITGAGERATLSALVGPGMKAVTIRVNDVEGVGGFVLPGDHVDVVLTRQIDKTQASTEIVLQNTRVLAVDQQADVRSDKAAIAKAVTLEVGTPEAQRLWLAASVGNLSLLLRRAGETTAETTRKVTLSDLNGTSGTADQGDVRKVTVTRGSERKEYNVPADAGQSALGAHLLRAER